MTENIIRNDNLDFNHELRQCVRASLANAVLIRGLLKQIHSLQNKQAYQRECELQARYQRNMLAVLVAIQFIALVIQQWKGG